MARRPARAEVGIQQLEKGPGQRRQEEVLVTVDGQQADSLLKGAWLTCKHSSHIHLYQTFHNQDVSYSQSYPTTYQAACGFPFDGTSNNGTFTIDGILQLMKYGIIYIAHKGEYWLY